MLITWSCPRCKLTHSLVLKSGENRIECLCHYVFYLRMTKYEEDRPLESGTA